MLKSRLVKLLYLCGLGVALAALLPTTASISKGTDVMRDDANPAPFRKVEVQDNDKVALQMMHDLGAEQILPAGHGETMWKVPVHKMHMLPNRPSLQYRDEYDMVGANGIYFYPQQGEPPIPANLRQTKRQGYQLWLAKYDNPFAFYKTEKWLNERKIQILGRRTQTEFVLWLDDRQLAEIEAVVSPNGLFVWTGPYHPYYRFNPEVRDYVDKLTPNTTATIKVVIDLYKHSQVEASLQKLRDLAIGRILLGHGFDELARTVGYSLEIPAKELINIANWPDTFLISLYYPIVMDDEMQGQILAGNTTSTSEVKPSGPGYLNWLTGRGFSTSPTAYPMVAVADSGLDIGSNTPAHPDFYQQHFTSYC